MRKVIRGHSALANDRPPNVGGITPVIHKRLIYCRCITARSHYDAFMTASRYRYRRYRSAAMRLTPLRSLKCFLAQFSVRVNAALRHQDKHQRQLYCTCKQ